jgi:hypothetical protein
LPRLELGRQIQEKNHQWIDGFTSDHGPITAAQFYGCRYGKTC